MGDGVKSVQEPEEQNTVDVEELSDEQLEQLMLERLDAESKGEELPVTTAIVEDEDEQEIDEQEEKTEDSEEEPVEQEDSEEDGDEQEVLISKLRKQVEEKEAIFKAHSEEVGTTRKRNAELEEELARFRVQQPFAELDKTNLGDNYDSVDVETVDKIVQQRLRQDREQQQRVLLQQESIRAQNKDALKNLIPDIDSLIPEIADIFERERLTDAQGLAQFRADPYSQNATLVYAYAQRAQLEKQVKELTADKDKLKKKPDKVIAQIKKAGKKKKTLDDAGATSGGSPKTPELTDDYIWNHMTSEELDKELRRRELEELKLRSK